MNVQDPGAMTIQQSVGDSKGVNMPRDVEVIKTMLNDNIGRLHPFRPLPVDSSVSIELYHMIRLFQKRVVGLKRQDGRVDPNGKTIKKLRERTASAINDRGVPWLMKAYSQVGVAEERGLDDNNPRILGYMATFPQLMTHRYMRKKKVDDKYVKYDTGYKEGEVDENPWCGCFVGWCLRQSGYKVEPKGFRAREWRNWGKPSAPRPGAICVIKKQKGKSSKMTGSGWHVGFWTGGGANWLSMLGGNQTLHGRGQVCEVVFGSAWKIMAMQMPEEAYLLDANKSRMDPYAISDEGKVLTTGNLDRPDLWLEDSPEPGQETAGTGTLGLDLENSGPSNGGGQGAGTLGLGLESSSTIPLAMGTPPSISGRWFE